jgi:cation diffusion facilitator CzcD-associated flavoprotein CzcO
MVAEINSDILSSITAWLDRFNGAAKQCHSQDISDLFEIDSHWREIVALSWGISTTSGAQAIGTSLATALQRFGAHQFEIDPVRAEPQLADRAGVKVVEAFLKFQTHIGQGAALLRMKVQPKGSPMTQAWTLHTTLESIRGHEEKTLRALRSEPVFSRDFQGPNWLDKRNQSRQFADREPVVLIVGGGHAGLTVAARLGQLGVDTLVVDQIARIGDNWRNRYKGLMLHNQVHSNHLPYMPYPPTWQPYLPKDRIANWLEMYVDCMDIHFWTKTTFAGARFDEQHQVWNAEVKQADGISRMLHPKHIIMATSVSGSPNIPHIDTLDAFEGPVLHSSQFGDGAAWKDKHVMVIGTGTSAHDIAQDLHGNGVKVTMVQRSPTLVLNVEPSAQLYDGVYLGDGPSLEDRDLINTSIPLKIMLANHKRLTDQAKALDASTLEALEAVGFKLDYGVDGTGWPYLFRTRGGGYYFNVGCSDLIASKQIGLLQFDQIQHFTSSGVQFRNGASMPFDAVVLATGYKGHTHLLETLFGPLIANKVGRVWGFDTDTQELKNMWTSTAQKGLWFTGGAFSQCRAYSKYMALHIKAIELGLVHT